MSLGYVLKTQQVLEYYGMGRDDVASTIFNYGKDRNVAMTFEPGTLGGAKGMLGFSSSRDILTWVQKALPGRAR